MEDKEVMTNLTDEQLDEWEEDAKLERQDVIDRCGEDFVKDFNCDQICKLIQALRKEREENIKNKKWIDDLKQTLFEIRDYKFLRGPFNRGPNHDYRAGEFYIKVTFEFELPEDKEEYEIYHSSMDYYSALIEFREYILRKYKHKEASSKAAQNEYEEIKQKFFDCLEDLGVFL